MVDREKIIPCFLSVCIAFLLVLSICVYEIIKLENYIQKIESENRSQKYDIRSKNPLK
jgi:hypothetical protein